MKIAARIPNSTAKNELKETCQCASYHNSRTWMIAALIIVFFLALPNLRYPMHRDHAIFSLIAQGLLQGKKLYRDLWDTDPPGVFYAYIPIAKIFGRAMWSVGLVDIVWLLAMSACIFSFAKRYLGVAAASIATMIFTVWHCEADYVSAARTDSFLIFFVFLAWFLMAYPGKVPFLREASAGVALGAAFWMKYNALAFLPLILFLPYLDFTGLDARPPRLKLCISWRTWAGKAAAVIAGLGVVILAVLACFWLSGMWQYLKQCQFEVLPRYAVMEMQSRPHYWIWFIHATKIVLGYWTEAATVIALLVAGKRGHLYRLTPVLLAALSGYICAASQLGFRGPSFETVYPFLAMVWGYLGVSLFEGFQSLAQSCLDRGWKVARVMVWTLLATFVIFLSPSHALLEVEHYEAFAAWIKNPEMSYSLYWWPDGYEHNRSEYLVVDYLKKHSQPREGLFVWGDEPLLYLASGLEPPTRFISAQPLVALWGPPEWRKELIKDLQKRPPHFIAVGRDDTPYNISYTGLDSEQSLAHYPGLKSFLSKNYELAKDFQYFALYRIRASSQVAKTE